MSAPQRIKLERTKGWRKPDGAIVVARPSKWGNPIALWIIKRTWDDLYGPYTPADGRAAAVTAFRTDVLAGADHAPSVAEIRRELAGHDLACWCPLDQPCHADVLLEIANGGAS